MYFCLVLQESYKMVSKELLKEIIVYYQNTIPANLVKRDIQLPLDGKKIISLTGIRRSGKTYLLFDTINRLKQNNIAPEEIIYINFEDERINFKQEELDLILQVCYELYPDTKPNDFWFFFDEIQNIREWEKFMRRIYDTVTKNIFITGSNSFFLSTDIATSLRGRTLTYEVFPYNFNEYLKHLDVNTNYYLPAQKAVIINHFNNYLKNGGFPETTGNEWNKNLDILRNYFYVMLYKDLIERYGISSTAVLKYFIEKLVVNISKPFSINKIYNELRSQGFRLDKNLLYELLIYIENIYLAFRISKFDYSLVKRSASEKKVYFIDNGMVNSLSLVFSSDYGKLLENAVFLYLRSRYGDLFSDKIFFYKSSKNKECDFVLSDGKKIVAAIQVSYTLHDQETFKREIAGLENAVKKFNLKKGIIITAEQELEVKNTGFPVEVIPAYKFFLDNSFDF